MRVCLIAEKPSEAMGVLRHLHGVHPDLDPGAFALAYSNPFIHLNACFRLPRGLTWRDYPFVGQARYEPFRFGGPDHEGRPTFATRFHPGVRDAETCGQAYLAWSEPNPALADPDGEALARFRSADVVYAAVGPDPACWLALDRCLGHLGLATGASVRIVVVTGLWRSALDIALSDHAAPGDALHEAKVRQGRLRRRFDYAYLVNALAVHRRVLDAAGAVGSAPVPSKYALQALYHLRRTGERGKGDWVGDMREWTGASGQAVRTPEGRRIGLGSAVSWAGMVDMLMESGLVEAAGARSLRVSGLGHRFLALLHPDSEDRYLPFRLDAWTRLPAADAEARIDRYLRTFFGKQIRYLARNARD